MKIEYGSNNSGGVWWLSDNDWINLEKAGWYVEWGGLYFCGSEVPKGKKNCGKGKNCPGHRKANNAKSAKECRWLGSLATRATKDFPSVKDCLKEFERITGQDVSAEGCNCCGAPHHFSWDGGYCSGEDCLKYLYDNVPESFREAVKILNKN